MIRQLVTWWTNPTTIWNRPAQMGRDGREVWLLDRRWGSFVETLVSQLEDGEGGRGQKAASRFGAWVKRHFPHAFLIPEDADVREIRAWLDANTTDLWTAGDFPQFINGMFVFIRNPDDAVAFRMRFSAAYYATDSVEIDAFHAVMALMARQANAMRSLTYINING